MRMWVPLVSAFLGCSLATFLLLKWRRRRQVQDKIAMARSRRQRVFEQMGRAAQRFQEQNPNHQPEPILSLSLPELCQKLKDGSLTPESVVYTYVDKALRVTADVNCITDYIAEESQLLRMNSEGGKGLLYGVPVSIKDSINCKGSDTTLGFVKRLFQPAAEDAVIVQVYDCSNLIFGPTVHPLDHTKSPGGSSGGEGSLIKSGGSILGIGTDIGGSIRNPSGFCGICGLKTTSNRISKKGITPCIPGQRAVSMGVGPMARDVDSLALCLKALLCKKMFHLDPTVPPLPFNDQVYTSSRPLRIGYHETNSYSMPSPSVRRAVLETKELLERNGHVVCILSSGEGSRETGLYIFVMLKAAMNETFGTSELQLEGEPVDPNLKRTVLMLKLPYWIRRFLAWIISPIAIRQSITLSNVRERSVKELWKDHLEIEEYCREFTEEWKRLELDVLLCPAICPAFKSGSFERVPESVGLPVAVQCVALPWQEELCLRFMKEVEKLTREKSRNQ
ncbi:hypothetical protein Chor_003687 [Crotalus horridus]